MPISLIKSFENSFSLRYRLFYYILTSIFYALQAIYLLLNLGTFSNDQSGQKYGKYLIILSLLQIAISFFIIIIKVYQPLLFDKFFILIDSIIFGIAITCSLVPQIDHLKNLSFFYWVNFLLILYLCVSDSIILVPFRQIFNSIKNSISKPSRSNTNTYGKVGINSNEVNDLNPFYSQKNHNYSSQDEDDIEKNKNIGIKNGTIYLDSNQKILYNEEIKNGFRINLTKIPPNPLLSVPSNLSWDEFDQIKHLAESTSCHIYLALWHEQKIILKIIKEERLASSVSIAEFEMEEYVLRNICHPNVIRLLGSGNSPRKFLVLEYLAGGTLAQALGLREVNNFKNNIRKTFKFYETLSFAFHLAQALQYLHDGWSNSEINIIHRDLKPDNIGWTSDGVLKLFDFGLSTAIIANKDKNKSYKLTGNTGTLRYMAPEVVLNRSYNKSVDVYSFGILVWQIATGKIPFREMGKKSFVDKVVLRGLRPKLPKKWPQEFKDLLSDCWNENKANRPDFMRISEILFTLLEKEEQEQSNLNKKPSHIVKREVIRILKVLRPYLLILFFSLCIYCIIKSLYGNQVILFSSMGGLSSFACFSLISSYFDAWPIVSQSLDFDTPTISRTQFQSNETSNLHSISTQELIHNSSLEQQSYNPIQSSTSSI